jgi:hypothetical protein
MIPRETASIGVPSPHIVLRRSRHTHDHSASDAREYGESSVGHGVTVGLHITDNR